MATLEKIRSKSVFLIVVIGLALLAFIIGDALTNSRNLFGDHTTVAKVGNEKIDYTDYQRKREELNNRLEQARQQNPAQMANFDVQLLPQMAIDELISEKLLDEAANNAGIQSSSNQLRYYVMENTNNQSMQQLLQQLNASGISAATPTQAYEVIFNPKRNNLTEEAVAPFQRAWIAMEDEARQMAKRQTYQRLVYGTVKANDLDRQALYNDFVETANVEMAFLPFGQLDPKKYPVEDKDLRAAYDEEKNNFKVTEPTKDISFIAVSIAPSAADRQAAAELARKTLAQLNDSSASLSKDVKKEGVSIERHVSRASDIPAGAVKDYLASAPVDSASIVSESLQGFTIVKLGKRYTDVDSVQINLVQVAGEGLANRVLASLNAGLAADSVPSRFAADSVHVQSAQWIPLYSAEGKLNSMSKEQLDSLYGANGKYISLFSSADGSVFANLVKKADPKQIYEYEQINYVLGPSNATLNAERDKLDKFLAANKTAKDFNDNAAKEGYTVQRFSVSQTSPAVPVMSGMHQYYPDSRQVIRWVMIDGKDGEVSHIYESKDAVSPALYAVAIDASYDDFIPLSNADVRQYVTDKARRSKAGDEMVKQYQPKAQTVASAAQAMGVEPRNVATFRFSNSANVRDAAVMGRIAGSNADKKVVVIKGDDGVYVYQVVGKNKDSFPYEAQRYDQQYFQLVNPQFDQMLRGSKPVKNSAYKFEAGD